MIVDYVMDSKKGISFEILFYLSSDIRFVSSVAINIENR